MNHHAEVMCPVCGEIFSLPVPAPDEVPCEFDYDCEVCCSPMRVVCTGEDGEVSAVACGLGE